MLPRPRHLSSPALPPVSKNGTRSHQRSLLWRLPGISAEFVWNKNDTAVDTFVLSIHGGPFRICFPTVETAYKLYIYISVCVCNREIHLQFVTLVHHPLYFNWQPWHISRLKSSSLEQRLLGDEMRRVETANVGEHLGQVDSWALTSSTSTVSQ